jgi:hypothetical protein
MASSTILKALPAQLRRRTGVQSKYHAQPQGIVAVPVLLATMVVTIFEPNYMSGEYLRSDLHLDHRFSNAAYVSSLHAPIACQGHPAHPPTGRLWKRRFILPMRP